MDSVSDDLLRLATMPPTARLPCSPKTLFRTISPQSGGPHGQLTDVSSTDRLAQSSISYWKIWISENIKGDSIPVKRSNQSNNPSSLFKSSQTLPQLSQNGPHHRPLHPGLRRPRSGYHQHPVPEQVRHLPQLWRPQRGPVCCRARCLLLRRL